jgi:hypothetical protein
LGTNNHNRKRAFADVVTIDAWHEDFTGNRSRVDLHTDVVFGTARLGGEIDSKVRFRLSIKRAEVAVIIPDGEPVSVEKKSVSRDSPEFKGRLTETVEEKADVNAKAKLSGAISSTKLAAALSAETRGGASRSKTKRVSVSSAIKTMLVTQSQTEEGHYRWIIETQTSKTLEGRPWDPNKQPRLKLIDLRKSRSKGIPPTVRVEVRCRREDFVIDNLEIKDSTLWKVVKSKAGFINKIAAAESYIRDHLIREGLEVENIGDIFGQVTLASTTAETG